MRVSKKGSALTSTSSRTTLPACRLLFGASARNDAEFADVVDGVLTDAAATVVSTLIEIHGSPEHRLVLGARESWEWPKESAVML